MSKRKDITGQRFGNLIAISCVGRRGHSSYWNCLCGCGKKKDISMDHLSTGHTKSCGCSHYERIKKPADYNELRERLEEKTMPIPESGCLIWMGCETGKGYSQIRFNGKLQFVHRLSYSLAFGEITNNLCVLHRCDTPSCINPRHLFLGTKKDNIRDCISKGRQGFSKRMDNRKISFNGLTKTISEWGRHTNIGHRLIGQRIKMGWSIERALTTIPIVGRNQSSKF